MDTNKTKEMVKMAHQLIEDKKGENITIIDISNVSVIADYFIIAHGKNRNQVQAMADEVEKTLVHSGHSLKQIEGYASANWVLLDFTDVIIHLFAEEERHFYDLERIWGDGKFVDINDL